jgi:hypothetical protein
MRGCCRAAVEACFAVEIAVEGSKISTANGTGNGGRTTCLLPPWLPLPSVLDADFIVFDGTCGDRQQVLALDIVHVVDDSVDALFRSGFKVSALLSSESAK